MRCTWNHHFAHSNRIEWIQFVLKLLSFFLPRSDFQFSINRLNRSKMVYTKNAMLTWILNSFVLLFYILFKTTKHSQCVCLCTMTFHLLNGLNCWSYETSIRCLYPNSDYGCHITHTHTCLHPIRSGVIFSKLPFDVIQVNLNRFSSHNKFQWKLFIRNGMAKLSIDLFINCICLPIRSGEDSIDWFVICGVFHEKP